MGFVHSTLDTFEFSIVATSHIVLYSGLVHANRDFVCVSSSPR